jgi:hypothetical protein
LPVQIVRFSFAAPHLIKNPVINFYDASDQNRRNDTALTHPLKPSEKYQADQSRYDYIKNIKEYFCSLTHFFY